jgi:hypothetical protein
VGAVYVRQAGLARTNRPQTGHTCLVRAEMRSTLSIDNINTQYIYIYMMDRPTEQKLPTYRMPRAPGPAPRARTPRRDPPCADRPTEQKLPTYRMPRAPSPAPRARTPRRGPPCARCAPRPPRPRAPRTHAPARPAHRPLCPARRTAQRSVNCVRIEVEQPSSAPANARATGYAAALHPRCVPASPFC